MRLTQTGERKGGKLACAFASSLVQTATTANLDRAFHVFIYCTIQNDGIKSQRLRTRCVILVSPSIRFVNIIDLPALISFCVLESPLKLGLEQAGLDSA